MSLKLYHGVFRIVQVNGVIKTCCKPIFVATATNVSNLNPKVACMGNMRHILIAGPRVFRVSHCDSVSQIYSRLNLYAKGTKGCEFQHTTCNSSASIGDVLSRPPLLSLPGAEIIRGTQKLGSSWIRPRALFS